MWVWHKERRKRRRSASLKIDKVLIIMCVLLVLLPDTASAQMVGGSAADWSCLNACFILGAPVMFSRFSLQVTAEGVFVPALDIPYIYLTVFNNDYLQVKLGGLLRWRLSEFIIDGLLMSGLKFFPSKKYFNLHTRLYVGSLTFTHFTLLGEFGAELEVPFTEPDNTIGLYIGGNFFVQGTWPIAANIWNNALLINSCGLSLVFGFWVKL